VRAPLREKDWRLLTIGSFRFMLHQLDQDFGKTPLLFRGSDVPRFGDPWDEDHVDDAFTDRAPRPVGDWLHFREVGANRHPDTVLAGAPLVATKAVVWLSRLNPSEKSSIAALQFDLRRADRSDVLVRSMVAKLADRPTATSA
jgi:hypothetical protein